MKAASYKNHLYWVSWYQPTEDFRPLTDPPNVGVLAWWNSGERCDDGAATLCAIVEARSERKAKTAVKKDWPEASEWRFCEEKPDGFLPGDRFPITRKWEKERLGLS